MPLLHLGVSPPVNLIVRRQFDAQREPWQQPKYIARELNAIWLKVEYS